MPRRVGITIFIKKILTMSGYCMKSTSSWSSSSRSSPTSSNPKSKSLISSSFIFSLLCIGTTPFESIISSSSSSFIFALLCIGTTQFEVSVNSPEVSQCVPISTSLEFTPTSFDFSLRGLCLVPL
ncbi:unnamed protein product [Meganyctiphanes norvegica]|uniref:Uncharacterized protein n=1 Tax=Meganyctiphanes norvegica TaxID=48144 RepID=A0AAV2RC50_MEGNR